MSPDSTGRSTHSMGTRWRRPLDGHSALRATSMRAGSAVIVAVAGEVDAGNEDAWSLLVGKMAAVATVPGPFVVDVRNLTFMNCGAYAVLGREAKGCRRRGVNLCLVSTQPIVARTVAATGLRPVLSIYPTVEMAVLRAAAEPFARRLTVARR